MMRDRGHVHADGQKARNDAGNEQLADILLGDDPVDGKHGRRRQHSAERAAGGDHAGCETLGIAEATHLRIGDGRKRRSRGDRRTADGGKAAAGCDGCDAKSAAQMADERIGGAKQLAAHAGVGHERTHQQEHRYDAEGVVGDGAHRCLPDQLERRRAAVEVGKARYADEAHRHADRHAQQHQREQRKETDDGNGIGAHAVIRPV